MRESLIFAIILSELSEPPPFQTLSIGFHILYCMLMNPCVYVLPVSMKSLHLPCEIYITDMNSILPLMCLKRVSVYSC